MLLDFFFLSVSVAVLIGVSRAAWRLAFKDRPYAKSSSASSSDSSLPHSDFSSHHSCDAGGDGGCD